MTKYITECKRGHLYEGENVRVNSKGSRYCHPCHQLAVRSYQERHGVRLLDLGRIRRNKKKKILVDEAGGKCERCGYNEHLAALDFDHLDPTEKSNEVGLLLSMKIETARAEAAKCRLLCANCHRIWTSDPEAFATAPVQ